MLHTYCLLNIIVYDLRYVCTFKITTDEQFCVYTVMATEKLDIGLEKESF